MRLDDDSRRIAACGPHPSNAPASGSRRLNKSRPCRSSPFQRRVIAENNFTDILVLIDLANFQSSFQPLGVKMVPHVVGPTRLETTKPTEQASGLRRTRSKREVIADTLENVWGKRPSKKGAGSPGSVNEGFAQAGAMFGSVGTTSFKQLQEQKRELRHGTTMVVRELDKILGDARSVKSSGARSQTSLTGIIHVRKPRHDWLLRS